MENPFEKTVAHDIIADALGNITDNQHIIAERVRDKLLERGLVRKEQLIRIQITIADAVQAHRQTVARRMAGVSLQQTILAALMEKQLLK